MLPVYPQYNFFKFLKRHLEPSGSGLIVDGPCGEGHISHWVAKAFPSRRVLGVDIDHGCISHANSFFHRANLDFAEQDIHSFLDTDREIDHFLLVNSIFLLPLPRQIMRKIREKLSNRGSAIVITPNPESENFKNFQRLNPGQNTLVMKKDEAVDFFQAAGFSVESVKGVGFATVYGNRLLGRMGRLKGIYIYVGNFLNRLTGKKPSYWGFSLRKA